MKEIHTGQTLYLNGDEGYGMLEPDEASVERFQKEKVRMDERKKRFAAAAVQPAVTIDGRAVSVCVNTGDPESLKTLRMEHCDGVGLYRTEFLFMDQSDYPDEELQLAAYRQIAESAKGKEVIIRTLDIGGDKQAGYMDIPKENNPFLGYRAIRFCLDREEIFLTQLRAILRASAFGNLKVMLPMIVTVEEVRRARELLERAKDSLRKDGTAFRENIPLGIMIETPASVLISDKLAKEVSFFSIGTNDLVQYTTAADRMNARVQYLYNPCNLSVLRAIHLVIRNAHRRGITVGMCGEMASNESFAPLLLSMGLDEFSVAPAQVGKIKYFIRRSTPGSLSGFVEKVLACDTVGEVKILLDESVRQGTSQAGRARKRRKHPGDPIGTAGKSICLELAFHL